MVVPPQSSYTMHSPSSSCEMRASGRVDVGGQLLECEVLEAQTSDGFVAGVLAAECLDQHGADCEVSGRR